MNIIQQSESKNPNHWCFNGDKHMRFPKKKAVTYWSLKKKIPYAFYLLGSSVSEALCNMNPTVDKIQGEDSLSCSSRKSNWFQKQSYMTNGLIVLPELEILIELFFIIIKKRFWNNSALHSCVVCVCVCVCVCRGNVLL